MLLLLLSSLAFAQDTEASLRAENEALREAVDAQAEQIRLLEAAAKEDAQAIAALEQSLSFRDQQIAALNTTIEIQGKQIDLYAVQLDRSETLSREWEGMYRAELQRKGPGKVERWVWVGVTGLLAAGIVYQSVTDDGVTVINTASP